MKPDSRQIKVLQDYLHKTLNYRESYEEVYDHIICALESQPTDIVFEDAVNNIIRNDFGGHNNLLKVEAGMKATITTEANKAFAECLKSLFKFPGANYPIAAGIVIYGILCTRKFVPLTLSFVAIVIIFVPPLIALIRYYKMGYLFGDKGKSMRDESFRYLSYRPMWLFTMATLYLPMWHIIKFNIWENTHPIVTTLYLLIPLMYNMAIFKLYKSELDLRRVK